MMRLAATAASVKTASPAAAIARGTPRSAIVRAIRCRVPLDHAGRGRSGRGCFSASVFATTVDDEGVWGAGSSEKDRA